MEEAAYRARIDRLITLRRARAALDAEEQRLLHELISDPPPMFLQPDPEVDKQWVREEVACALQLAPVTAAGKIVEASDLVERLPATFALLEAGDITLRHALRLVEATVSLPDETVTVVEDRVLKRAPNQTPSQFGQSVRRAVLRLHPQSEQAKREQGVADRRVCFTAQDDGTTTLWALLPAETATALRAALDTRADELRTPDDQRTVDQRRADALIDLALGTGAVQPRINVTVALSTLLELDDQPGELTQHGPIPAELARSPSTRPAPGVDC